MRFLLLASLLWGPSFGLIGVLRTEVPGLDSFSISLIRMVLSLLLFLPFLRPAHVARRAAFPLMAVGALQFGLMYILYIRAFAFLSPAVVALMTVFTPIYVTLLHDAAERRFHRTAFFCATLAMAGAWLLQHGPLASKDFFTGFLLMQVANLCFAAGQVLYRRVHASTPGLRDLHAFALLYVGAVSITALAWSLDHPGGALQVIGSLGLRHWAILLWLGLVPSGLAFFLWNHGALKVSAGTLAVFNDLKIPLGALISLTVFGEHPANWPRFVLGAALMLAALALNERHARA